MANHLKRFQNFSHHHRLWEKGDKIIIGVSGGPDSVCLFSLFLSLQKKYALSLVIAHVNYGLRGKDSDRDEAFVKKMAKDSEIEFKLLKPKIGMKNRSEENLRKIRYDFFEKIRKNEGYDLIAVGHNLDDRVETYLMRILRGASLKGLRSMQPKNGFIIRPLLGFTRDKIINYLKSHKIKFRIDHSNKDRTFTRNRVRHELIPYLENNFNPNLKKTLAKNIENINDDFEIIEFLMNKNPDLALPLSVKKLQNYPIGLQKRLLLLSIEKARGDLMDIDSSHLDEIIKIVYSAKSKNQLFKLRDLKITRKGDKITMNQTG